MGLTAALSLMALLFTAAGPASPAVRAEVDRAAVAERLARIATPPVEAVEDSGGSAGGNVAGIAVIGAGVGVGVLALVRARKRLARRFDERRAALAPLIDALATQVDTLWQEISDGGERADAAQVHWDEAAQAQLAARDRLDRARGEDDLSAARLHIERGLRAAQRSRAILEGRPEPDPSAPLLDGLCAFDPGHGQAADAVAVTTPKGDTADVPACAACAAKLAEGATPDVRRTWRDGRDVPYWAGAGWGGGMMPSFGGFLGGMFLADLLVDHHPSDMNVFAGDPGAGSDGGDYGDGDYGGGDFGDSGGDWGGGDFGGGDFGGGGDF